MNLQFIDTQQRLEKLAALIALNPASWNGWQALRVEICGMSEDQQGDSLLWVKSILDSQLGHLEGHLYLSPGQNIHIIVRGSGQKILRELGQQICDLILSENIIGSKYMVYDLVENGLIYAQHVFDQGDGKLVLPEAKTTTSGRTNADLRVLLIEDDAVTRWMVRNTLKGLCEFATAPSAAKAYALFPSFQPDLIFLDIGLPDEDGEHVLKWVKSSNPHTAVVMFSGQNRLENIMQTLENGADGFISKPFVKENLLTYLKERLVHAALA